jgi:hypothetical protein
MFFAICDCVLGDDVLCGFGPDGCLAICGPDDVLLVVDGAEE